MYPELPAVLLMGDRDSMGPVNKNIASLGESLFDKELGKPIVQPVVICCPNKTTDDELLFYLDKEEIDEEICGNSIVL